MRFSLLVLFTALSACNMKMDKPNILFLFSDDHTTQAISAYGDWRINTPNLDKLVHEGLLFENCFCTNSICAPSRAVVLTGKYSHLNGVRDNSQVFDGEQETFPKLLQKAGYRTAIIGKWHLKSEPSGFDYWSVLPGQGKYFDPDFIEMGNRINKKGYVTEIITDDALLWLKTYNYEQPFCLMVQHKAPHADWEWPEEYSDEFMDDFILPENFEDNYAGRSPALKYSALKVDTFQWNYHYKYRFGAYPYDSREEMYQRYMHDYMRCIRAVDNSIGQLMEGLMETGQYDNTIVIYSADQGFFLGEHGLYDKRFMYEEALRMPLIIKAGKQAKQSEVPTAKLVREGRKAGSRIKENSYKNLRIEEMVLNLDFGPTILDLAGVKIPQEMQGRSFAPLIWGDKIPDWRESMYYHFYEQAYNIGEHEGIRTGKYKLIHFSYPEDAWELYDIQNDPAEMNNLCNEPGMQSIIKDLQREMDSLKMHYK